MRQYRSPRATANRTKRCVIEIEISDDKGLQWQAKGNELENTEAIGALEIVKAQWLNGMIRNGGEDKS